MTLQEVLGKSNKTLQGVHPMVRFMATWLIIACYMAGVPIMITQGLRSIAYQNGLYSQGRDGNPEPIVTDARGGFSFHNFGLAIDFALLSPDGKKILYDLYRDDDKDGLRDWDEVVSIAQKIGFFWGIRLKNGVLDRPHFQFTYGLSTARLRTGSKPPSLIAEAANKFIAEQLQPGWKAAKTDEQRKIIGTLADEMRIATGQKPHNS